MRLEEALKLSHMAISDSDIEYCGANMTDRIFYATKMAVVEERYSKADGEVLYAGPVIDQNDVIGRTDWRPLGVMDKVG